MVKVFICSVLVNICTIAICQKDLVIVKDQQIPEMRVDKNFNQKYKQQLRLLKRTYPMALKAKELIDEYEADLADIDKKRKKKKYGKEAHQQLKDEFTYNIRDLYESEGRILMKLVYRETGMTVNEIVKNYRNGLQTFMYSGVAKIFGQDLDATYDAKGDDWITEIVIQDILSGRISFDTRMRKIEKSDYKDSMAEYRDRGKKLRAAKREKKKNKK